MYASKKPSAVELALITAFGLAACGGKEEAKPAAPPAPVAAKVNAGEVTVAQVNNVLSRTQNVTPEQSKQLAKQVLERLIDQELLVQKAREQKVDRDPKVMQAIEASQREILARAYLEQVAGAAVKPTAQEITEYYNKHPELFGERRIYNLRELAVAVRQDQVPMLQEELGRAKSMNDLAAWLKGQNIPFQASQGVKTAEQLPMEVVQRFHKLKDGQVALLPTPQAILIVQLVASQSQPLDEAKATPFIEQFLTNQKRAELADKEVKALRAAGKVEYVGEFAKSDAGTPAAPAAPAGMTGGAQPGSAQK